MTDDGFRRRFLPIASPYGDGEMAVLDFGDPSRPVDLVFVHANGFNAHTYRSLLTPLAGDLRIWALDLRGHGRSRLPLPDRRLKGWDVHARDILSLLERIDGPPVAVAGHSMGAVSSLLAAGREGSRIKNLMLFDPVIWSRTAMTLFSLPGASRLSERSPLARGALRRRSRFDSREQAFQSYRGRGAFRGWPDDMVMDYLADGLVEDQTGALVLACSPAWEAANYAAQAHNPYAAIRRYGGPVRVLKGERNSTCSLPVGQRGRLMVEAVEGGTHFFPMIQRDLARDTLLAACLAQNPA